MRLNIFILGALAETPLSLDSLITLSKKVRINKWTDFSEEILHERIDLLKNTNLLNKLESNQIFVPTEMGYNYYKLQIKSYLREKNINIGMLILSLTFSNHFDSDEFNFLVKKRIEALETSVKNLDNLIHAEYLSNVYNLCLNSFLLLANNEITILKLFLSYEKNNISIEPLINVLFNEE